jgi:hypothetical protein
MCMNSKVAAPCLINLRRWNLHGSGCAIMYSTSCIATRSSSSGASNLISAALFTVPRTQPGARDFITNSAMGLELEKGTFRAWEKRGDKPDQLCCCRGEKRLQSRTGRNLDGCLANFAPNHGSHSL